MSEETVWLTQKQMAQLFGKDQNTINEHINNIFKEKELYEVTSTGISGKSSGGRKPWATKILKDYMLKGYAINQRRLEYLKKIEL